MADSSDVSSLERVADVLGRHGVEFIVVGGQAALLHGSPCVTYDIGDLHLKTISLDDLIRIKEHINRPKDRAAARQLRAIRDLPAD